MSSQYSQVNFSNELVFTTKSEDIDDKTILTLLENEDISNKVKCNITWVNLPNYVRNIETAEGKRYVNTFIISPTKLYLVTLTDEITTLSVADSYPLVDPIIQYYWILYSEKEKSIYKLQFSKFILKYPNLEKKISFKEYIAFQDYLAMDYFNNLLNQELQDIDLLDQQKMSIEFTDSQKVYLPARLYPKITSQLSPNTLLKLYEDLTKIELNSKELAFMFYCNEILFKKLHIKFHHLPDIYNRMGFIEFAYRKIPNIKFGILLLSRAIDIELKNNYVSLNLITYFNSIRHYLNLDNKRQEEVFFHLQLAYNKLEDYLQHQLTNLKIDITSNEIDIIISTLRDVKHSMDHYSFEFITYDQFYHILAYIVQIPDVKLTFLNKVTLQYLVYTIKFDSIDQPRDLKAFWDQISVITPPISFEFEQEVVESAKLLHIMEYIVYHFQHSTENAELLFSDKLFIRTLNNYFNSTINSLETNNQATLVSTHRFLDIFENLQIVFSIFYSGESADKKLSDLLLLMNKTTKKPKLINIVNRRILLFITQNFNIISPEYIRNYLLSLNETNSSFFSVDILIRNLLLQLLGDRDLTSSDYKYMREYLDLDDEMLEDDSSDGIADLIYYLDQLEESPTVVIDNDDGTLTELTFSQPSDIHEHNPSDPDLPLPYLPAPIFDLFDDDDENLDHYLRLFFRFHRIKQDLAQQDNSDPERFYYELLEVDPEKQLLNDYFAKLTILRKDHPQIVDDILVEILTIELILREFPSFTIPRLAKLRKRMLERDVDPITWEQFIKLSLSVYIKLDLSDEISNTQLQLDLLDLYNGLDPLLVGDLPSLKRYFDLTNKLNPELALTIEEHSDLADFIAALVAHSTHSLPQFITTDVVPLVEFMIQIHLSWQSATELEHITEIARLNNIPLVFEQLEQASSIPLYQWSQGLLLHPVMIQLRMLELQQKEVTPVFLMQLHEAFHNIPEKQRAIWDSLQALLERYDDHSTKTDETNLLDLI